MRRIRRGGWAMMAWWVAMGAWAAAATTARAQVTIVEDGQPRAVIVTADEPSASAQAAATALQVTIEKISGATLPIIAGDVPAEQQSMARLIVGHSPAARATGVDIPTGENADFSKEGFVLKTLDNAVLVAGNETGWYQGTQYAAYELLEQLGCRWFFPGEFGEVIPQMKSVTVPRLDIASSPSFVVRNIWTSGWADVTGDLPPFMTRNKGTARGPFAFPGDGTIAKLAPMEKYYEQYPDLYAIGADGQPQGPDTPPHLVMIDTTHPKAVAIAAESIMQHFRENPQETSFGFSAPDGSPRSRSAAAVAGDHAFMTDARNDISISDGYYNFVNNVMHEVANEFPDHMILVLAYANRVRPPEGLDRPWHPNIIVSLARLRLGTLRPLGDERDFQAVRHARTLEAWARICPRLLIYDYDPHVDLGRMPFWRISAIPRDMRFYKDHNVIGFTTEGHNTYLRTGPNYYLRTKLMWDVNADAAALMEDFYAKFFEDAAAPMRKFHESIDEMVDVTPDNMTWTSTVIDWTSIYPPRQVEALGALLDEAEQLANSEKVKTRVAAYRHLHDYMLAYSAVFTALREARYRDAEQARQQLAAPIEKLQAIQPGLLPPDPQWVLDTGGGAAWLENKLKILLDRTGDGTRPGELGMLLGVAPMQGQFITDRNNIGLYDQWQRGGDLWPAERSKQIDLTRSWSLQGYRDAEGFPFDGLAWYKFEIDVDGLDAAGGPAQLVIPHTANAESWIWLNGELVYSPGDRAQRKNAAATEPDRPFVIEYRGYSFIQCNVAQQIRPGANTVTMRVMGTRTRLEHYGLMERPFVFQPADK